LHVVKILDKKNTLMNAIKYLFITILVIASSPRMSAQSYPVDVHLTLIQGQVFIDTIEGVESAVFLNQHPNISGTTVNLGSKKWRITITPQNNFLGNGSLDLQYVKGPAPFFKPYWSRFHVNVVSSIVNANDDYVIIDGENPVVIHPLQNDVTTANNISLSGIGQVSYGEAIIEGDSIIYTPNENGINDHIIYSVTDDYGSKAQGKIHILYANEHQNIVHDSLYFTLLNSSTQTIVFPNAGYNPQTNPLKGILTQPNELVYNYKPNEGAVGNEILIFEKDGGSTKSVFIKILSSPVLGSSVKDDQVYTPKNTAVSFDVLANDLSRNFPIVWFSNGLVYEGNGVFSYTPPTGFVGVKNFSYRVNYGNLQATGKIAIHVGNFEPQTNLTYHFNTDKNTPIVLNYDVPIEGYSFENLIAPQFGTIQSFTEGDTLNIDCNSVTGKYFTVYTPDNNYYGEDEFQVNYCIDGAQCIVYKVNITIHNSSQDSLCNCIGKDCVWAGDMNGDGRVSVADLLPLGRFIGLTGDSREDIVYNYWAGQSSVDWGTRQNNGTDIKHIDANGDGILNEEDALSIDEYYEDVHNFVPKEILSIKEFPFQLIPNTTNLDSGDLLVLQISIGNTQFPVVDLHGLAFGLNINSNIIDSSSFAGEFYHNSWFNYANPSLQMLKQPFAGAVHAALTRTGGKGVSGNGIIGQVSYIVVDEIDGWKDSGYAPFFKSRISTENILIENEFGEHFALEDTYIDIQINKNIEAPIPTEEKLIVYPNPASDVVQLHFNGRNTIYGYTILDIFGNVVVSNNNYHEQHVKIDTQQLPSGMYIVKVTSALGVITKKVEVLK